MLAFIVRVKVEMNSATLDSVKMIRALTRSELILCVLLAHPESTPVIDGQTAFKLTALKIPLVQTHHEDIRFLGVGCYYSVCSIYTG